MTIWSGEIKELDKLYVSFKGHLPDIVKEMEQLIRTDDANVVMLYARRCLEVIVTDLCESELKRPRKTEPLKGILDKLNSEEKVPSHIITSMQSLNSMATYGTHPKDFDPEQVKPVLNNLAIIIKWYLKYKDFRIVSNSEPIAEKVETEQREIPSRKSPKKKKGWIIMVAGLSLIAAIVLVIRISVAARDKKHAEKYMSAASYKTVKIGTQVWMAENLKTTLFNDGTPIPLVKDDKEWDNLTTPGYCWYENNRGKYMETYGALYNWFAVNTGKLCPVGWHVPTDAEWTTLTWFLGDTLKWIDSGDSIIMVPEVSGIKLKEAGNLHWQPLDSIHSTNEFGFTALPGGSRLKHGPFIDIGLEARWWCAEEYKYDEGDGHDREMFFNQNGVTDLHQYKQFGMSVRCIRDELIP